MRTVPALAAWIAAKTRELLQGQPLRMISVGAIAVVWLVTRIAIWTHLEAGSAPSLDAIAAAVTVAIGFVTEFARLYVWSPSSVTQAIANAALQAVNTGYVNLPGNIAGVAYDPSAVAELDATPEPADETATLTPDPAAAEPAVDPAATSDPPPLEAAEDPATVVGGPSVAKAIIAGSALVPGSAAWYAAAKAARG